MKTSSEKTSSESGQFGYLPSGPASPHPPESVREGKEKRATAQVFPIFRSELLISSKLDRVFVLFIVWNIHLGIDVSVFDFKPGRSILHWLLWGMKRIWGFDGWRMERSNSYEEIWRSFAVIMILERNRSKWRRWMRKRVRPDTKILMKFILDTATDMRSLTLCSWLSDYDQWNAKKCCQQFAESYFFWKLVEPTRRLPRLVVPVCTL